jgi:CheY-like chemotaxis protein
VSLGARQAFAAAPGGAPGEKPDLNQSVRAALELVCDGIRSAGIKVTGDLGGDLPTFSADPDQLGQLITNLILNSQQALRDVPQPGRLRIQTRHKSAQSQLRLVISDNGPGIPCNLRSRVFEPFFTTKPVGSGTGIGLSICHAIVSAWWLDRSTFHQAAARLYDPPARRRSRGAGLSAHVERVPEIARCRALVIDDERDLAELIAEMLTREGFAAEVATSGEEALAELRRCSYDLVLSDVRMPGLDGPALLCRLQSEWPALAEQVIFVTGDTLGLGAGSALDGLGRPVIEKPISPDEMRRVIHATLAGVSL